MERRVETHESPIIVGMRKVNSLSQHGAVYGVCEAKDNRETGGSTRGEAYNQPYTAKQGSLSRELCYVQEVVDTTCGHNCGQKLEVVIVSPLFEGKGLLQRHRLVNEALADEIAQLHAFSQKTLTPAQWTAKKS